MPFKYRRNIANTLIATGDITGVDDGMGIAVGSFSSLPAYESVRSIFEALSESSSSDLSSLYAKRDALGLELCDENNTPIPTEWISIVDLRRAHDDEDAAELDAALSNVLDVQHILKALSKNDSL